MILGVGIDIVDLGQFREQLEDGASHFVNRVFTPRERAAAGVKERRELYLAGRFAAKEAFVKAWSSARQGSPPLLKELPFSDIEILSDRYGRPQLTVSGSISRALDPFSPYRLHVSISHDGNYAAAVVVIESV